MIPFFPLSQFYKNKFGFKVQKIPLTIASTCPNRLGLKGMQTCIFCDEWGSSAYPEQRTQTVTEQIQEKMGFLGHHRSAENFLAYFQTYTSTFLGVKKLRESFEEALKFPEIKGVIIGTRPDCISDAVIQLVNEFKEKTYIAVELGVQSFNDETLVYMRRGHDSSASEKAVKVIKEKTGVDVGIHLIFGWPQETNEDLIRTAQICNSLDIQHVKIHHLHVLKNTPLEEEYLAGRFQPLSLEEYAPRVTLFLEHLSPAISVERLAALSSRWDELVAPEWTKWKLKTREYIIAHMKARQSYQGKRIPAPTSSS